MRDYQGWLISAILFFLTGFVLYVATGGYHLGSSCLREEGIIEVGTLCPVAAHSLDVIAELIINTFSIGAVVAGVICFFVFMKLRHDYVA